MGSSAPTQPQRGLPLSCRTPPHQGSAQSWARGWAQLLRGQLCQEKPPDPTGTSLWTLKAVWVPLGRDEPCSEWREQTPTLCEE